MNQTPTNLIILGATGDLVRRKIAPSLYNLYSEGLLPANFQIIAFARRDFSDESYRAYLAQAISGSHSTDHKTLQAFLQLFSYHQGFLDKESGYESLAAKLGLQGGEWTSCSNKLFYLAVPPEFYEHIFRNIAKFKLTRPCEDAWSRILVEKPFGRDLKTAEKLDMTLGELFHEDQIYRIDHYLAKETLQNIITFRFMNDIFEDSWNSQNIEKIEMRLWEKIGVEQRGAFYDGVGALRDMGQNHLMLMLALITMDRPASLSPDDLRKKRAQILEKLVIPSEKEIKTSSFRAQYDSYRSIENVDQFSGTETYFKLRAYLSSPRWRGVPIHMESGKRMGETAKDIIVTFRHSKNCLCGNSVHHRNRVVFSMDPEEKITIYFWAKKPAHNFETQERQFEFALRDPGNKHQYVEEYQKLLLDAIQGDQTLFTSTDEVRAMWHFIDPIVSAWRKDLIPLHFYSTDSSYITQQANDSLV